MTIVSVITLIVALGLLLPMVLWVPRYGLVGAFDRLANVLEALWTRLTYGPKPAPVVTPPRTQAQLNEAELLSPIEDMVATIERRLEHQAGQCGSDCRHCSMEKCTDCEHADILEFGVQEPVKTFTTAQCPKHRGVISIVDSTRTPLDRLRRQPPD